MGIRDRCAYTSEYCSTGDVAGNVSENPNGIGYISLSVLSDMVAAVAIDGVPCTAETVRNKSYPLQRPVFLVTKRNSGIPAAAQGFLDFAFSPEAADYIAMAGVVPP